MYVLVQVYLGSGITQHCKKGNIGPKDTAILGRRIYICRKEDKNGCNG